MVINLLSNAIKFTESGTVSVRAERENLSTSLRTGGSGENGGEELGISVSDTGKGIPQEEIATLFDEYRQVVGQSDSDVQKGTGLGLSITKKFAELLGGSISVESEIGKGSTFTITIPSTYSA
jgi:two-component system chemotaxis sensor kinase CheA